MSETENIAAIAGKIKNDIFRVFFWDMHSQENANFSCVCEEHKSENGKRKTTHPGDVIFHYFDPYLNKRIYLHTDLKAYSRSSVTASKIRDALKSLAMTLECAEISTGWRDVFLANDGESYEVRGLLFVANHDNKAPKKFDELFSKIALQNIPVAKGQVLHVLSPSDVNMLYSIAVDIKLRIHDGSMGEVYRFVYPDQTLWKRHTAEDERVGATIEMLLSPYFVIRYSAFSHDQTQVRRGAVVYYSRCGDTVEEFVYLLDVLSRYQLINSNEDLCVRVCSTTTSSNLKNNFDRAKSRYCQMWGFEGSRQQEVDSISIDTVQQITPNYKANELGWRQR